jgi:hypothetical protein
LESGAVQHPLDLAAVEQAIHRAPLQADPRAGSGADSTRERSQGDIRGATSDRR